MLINHSSKAMTQKKIDNLSTELSFLFLALLMVLVNEEFSFQNIGTFVALFQTFLVLLLTIMRFREYAVFFHSIFTFSAIEFSQNLVSNKLLNVRTIEFFGISLSMITWIVIFLTYYFTYNLYFNSIFNNKLIAYVLIFYIVGILNGIIGILFDNYSYSAFMYDFQYWTSFVIGVLIFSNSKQESLNRIIKYYKYYLICKGFYYVIIILFGKYKFDYGGIATITYDPVVFFGPFILFSLIGFSYSSLLYKLLVVSSAIAWTFVSIINSSGKTIIVLAFVYITFFLLMIRNVKRCVQKKCLTLVLSVIVLVLLIYLVLTVCDVFKQNFSFNFSLLKIKSYQVSESISLRWIKNPYILSKSPRDRVLEFYNTVLFYLNDRQIQLVLGRGFGGYFVDKWFYNYETTGKGDYTVEQIKTRKFYAVHESLNYVLLKFGIAGIIAMFILILKILFSNADLFEKSVALTGTLFFLGFTLNVSLLVGLFVVKADLYTKNEKFTNSSKLKNGVK